MSRHDLGRIREAGGGRHLTLVWPGGAVQRPAARLGIVRGLVQGALGGPSLDIAGQTRSGSAAGMKTTSWPLYLLVALMIVFAALLFLK
jgi:hypothetical protein